METRASLQVMVRRQDRSRSPVSVHEWVAALPDITRDTESEERTEERDNDIAEDDNLTLGAEGDQCWHCELTFILFPAGGYYSQGVKNVGQLIFNKNNKSGRARGPLQHSDTSTSLKSDVSVSRSDTGWG